MECVRQTEQLSLVLRSLTVGVGVVLAVFGFFVVKVPMREIEFIAFAVAVGVGGTWLVDNLVLASIRAVRYRGAARRLLDQLLTVPGTDSRRAWWEGGPGALAIQRGGHLLLTDRSTGYVPYALGSEQIVGVSVERRATHITDGDTHGHVGLFGGVKTQTRSVTRTVESASLEIRYQLEPNGMVRTAVVPFGDDRRGAEELCGTISRLVSA